MDLRPLGVRLIVGILALLAPLAAGAPLAAQQTGRIAGRVIDQQTGAGISGASVVVAATGAAAMSGVGGRFVIERVPAGTVSVRVENLGFATKTVTDVIVPPDGAVEVNVSLSPQALELAAITVTAAAERGSVNRALDQQRNATSIVSSITAEQMARSPDSDAAAAMQRVSGVTVQEGKFVFVRGLGERYTTTSLNGARVPSPEPERKVVPLDIFPAGLLQTITTSKTFTPDQAGDFSGAAVNIETREFPTDRQFTLSVSSGFTTGVTGSDVLAGPTFGGEWVGSIASQRKLPDAIANAGNLFDPRPQEETNRLVSSFTNAWDPRQQTAAPSGSFGLSVGGSDPILGQTISYLGSVTYSRGVDVRKDQVRAYALAGANGTTSEIDRYEGTTGVTSVLWGGLAQLSTLLGTRSRLIFNGTYNRSADNEARRELGRSENLGSNLQIERLRFIERDVFSTQLKGEHEIADRHRLDWVGTYSGVNRNEPNRSEIVYSELVDPATGESRGYGWFAGSPEGAVRTFGDLEENVLEGGLNYRLQLGGDDQPTYIKLGGNYRSTDRSAGSEVFSISAFGLTTAERQLEPEQIFDGRFTQPGENHLRLTPLSQGGSYSAEDRLAAGYLMADVGLTSSLRLIAGARVERDEVSITGQTTLFEPFSKETSYTDVLPAVSVNYSLTEDMNLRLSGSQTLARPEYRELADVTYREVIDGEAVRGNSNLTRTLIQNADLRWEWYMSPGEVLSVALFAKRFEDPIERVFLATSGTRLVTFVNADAANNYGVEIEARKRLGAIGGPLEAFTAFANLTLMESEIEIDAQSASQTNPTRPMVGQAPYVINAGLTWSPEAGSTSATLLYNTVGERIVSAGILPLPDVYEEPRHVLDFSLRHAFSSAVSAKFDAKNLIDSAYEETQGSVTRSYYTTGRSFSLGLSWRW